MLADAASWRTWYGVDGYYLEGAPATCDAVAAFSSAVAAIRTAHPGARVVANSYTVPPPCIADVVDTVVAFAGPATAFASWTPPAWVTSQPGLPGVDPGLGRAVRRPHGDGAARPLPQRRDRDAHDRQRRRLPLEHPPVDHRLGHRPLGDHGHLVHAGAIGPPVIGSQQIASVNYFSDGAAWNRSRSLGANARYVIVNPDNGPGATRFPAVQTEVDASRAVGQVPLGYVHTLWGGRSPAQVVADAELYRTRYGITGVFLDEAADSCAAAPHYETITTQLRAAGFGVVALNPGRPVPECYAFADGIVVYEGGLADYATLRPLAWMQRYPASKFWHLSTTCPRAR